ncbi:MAG TPA: DUF1839 family protein [Solirubrobacteraceae bacterium]|jgi:hypothetical protein|nr:DUF1839 family protein [Solirubrobacteraceae bacterium]
MSTTRSGLVSLLGLDPVTYSPHLLHARERSYTETNCYTDIVIEFLHARGEEPLAIMGCVLRVDFEGDQWTFFKPLPEQIERLFGVDIHEMQPYRPLPEQIAEQIARDRTIIVELDSFYLPDTASTSYRREHVKSSVVAEAIDREGQRLRYFHGAGYYELEGEDYRGIFRLGRPFSDDVLPPYTEIVRLDAGPSLEGRELRAAARELLVEHLARRPEPNPFLRFGEQLAADLPGLLEGSQAGYHDYAFATVRMVGSAFEVAASHVEWLLGDEGAPAAAAMGRIVEGSKVLSFKLARRRAFDPAPAIDELAAAWEDAFAALDDALA